MMQLSQVSIPEIGIGAVMSGCLADTQPQANTALDAFAPIVNGLIQDSQILADQNTLNVKMVLDTPEVAKQIKELLLANGQSGTQVSTPKDVLANLLNISKSVSESENNELTIIAVIPVSNVIDTPSNENLSNLIVDFKQQLQDKLETKLGNILPKEDLEKVISDVTSQLEENTAFENSNVINSKELSLSLTQIINYKAINKPTEVKLTEVKPTEVKPTETNIITTSSTVPQAIDDTIEPTIENLLQNLKSALDNLNSNGQREVILNDNSQTDITLDNIIPDNITETCTYEYPQIETDQSIVDSTEVKSEDSSTNDIIATLASYIMPIINNSMVEKVSIIKSESNSAIIKVQEKSGQIDTIAIPNINIPTRSNGHQNTSLIVHALTEAVSKSTESVKTGVNILPKIEVDVNLLTDNEKSGLKLTSKILNNDLGNQEQPQVNTKELNQNLKKALSEIIEIVDKKIDFTANQTISKGITSSEIEKVINTIKTEIQPVVDLINSRSAQNSIIVNPTKNEIQQSVSVINKMAPESGLVRNATKEDLSVTNTANQTIPFIVLNSKYTPKKSNVNLNDNSETKFTVDPTKSVFSNLDRSININKISSGDSIASNLKREIISGITSNFSKESIFNPGQEKQEKFKFDFLSSNNNAGNNISNLLLSSSIDPLNPTTRLMSNNLDLSNRIMSSNNSIIDQVAEKIKFNPGKTELSIQLNPNDLGKVDVSVSLQRGAVVAHMVAETVKAAESLKSGMDNLKQSLADSGINVDKIVITSADKSSFSNNNNNDNNQNNPKDNWLLNQNSNNNNNQNQEKQNFKDSFDLSNFKNNSGSQNKGNATKETQEKDSTNPNSSNLSENTNEGNFINTEKGRVNYRI